MILCFGVKYIFLVCNCTVICNVLKFCVYFMEGSIKFGCVCVFLSDVTTHLFTVHAACLLLRSAMVYGIFSDSTDRGHLLSFAIFAQ